METRDRLGNTVRGFEVAIFRSDKKRALVYGHWPQIGQPLTGEAALDLMQTMEARGFLVQARTESKWTEEYLSTEEMQSIYLP